MKSKQLYINESGAESRMLCNIYIADNFILRARGLLFRKKIGDSEGLLITRCNSVHTFGMRYPIDIVFLNAQMRIIEIVKSLAPYRFSINRKANAVLEFAGSFSETKKIRVGMACEWE